MARHHRISSRLLFAGMALAGLTTLSGCGLMVVGGAAATTAVVATDRRTAGEQVEDQAIEMKTSAEMRKLFAEKPARVHPTSYGGLLLLTGDVPTDQDRQQAQAAAAKVEKVKRVINEIRVGAVTPLSVRSNDTWITSKVAATLLNTKDVPARTIVAHTERGVVYLMGRVTADESERAGKAVSTVSGVNKVVKLFEIVARETLFNEQPAAPVQNVSPDTSGSGSDSGSTESSADVQTMPVQ